MSSSLFRSTGCRATPDKAALQSAERSNGLKRIEEHLDRLAADIDLRDRLMFAGYAGRDWEAFRAVLAAYGVQVLVGWCITGKIFVECQRVKFSLSALRRVIPREEAVEIAGETVAEALVFFRDSVLIPGKWDPTKGASLKTFFVGACKLRFPGVYRRWEKERRPISAISEDVDTVVDQNACRGPDFPVLLRQGLDAIPDDIVRQGLVLEAGGYTRAEIAEVLECSEKTVENHILRYQASVRARTAASPSKF